MPKFFVDENNIRDNIKIIGEDAKHISQVLRHKQGDVLEIGDGVGFDYTCEIIEMSKREILLKVIEKKENLSEPKVKITLFQCLPKGSKMDLIIQKCVELGVTEITPFYSEFTIVKVNDKTDNKIERYQKVSETASKQSRRGIIPKINSPLSFDEAIKLSKNFDLSLIAYEKEKNMTLKKVKENINKEIKNICVFVGSEGGFSIDEIEKSVEIGIIPITLGERILRTETAGMVLANLLIYEFDE